VSIWAGVTVDEGAFIGPNASLTNDLRPRSRPADWTLRETRIGRGATIGANATLLCGIEIGAFAFVGAGAVVTATVAPYTLVYGNPARPRGFVCRCAEPIAFKKNKAVCPACDRRYHRDRHGHVHPDAPEDTNAK
jgi:UDP-2-acetamido-3-amino-2,3-dideoxy-glucuronate N-acetyltransferase